MNSTATVNVLVTMRFTDAQLDKLRAVSPRLRVEQRPASDAAPLAHQLTPDVNVLYTLSGDFPLASAPNLGWVQTHSAGVEHLAGTELWASDVTITSMNGIHAAPIAEYVLLQILAFAHHMPRMLRFQARGEWAPHRWEAFAPRDVRGQTVGLIGYGAIGREVARQAQALGMRVVALKRNLDDRRYRGWPQPGVGDPEGVIPERFYPPEQLRDLLAEAHFVVVSAPLTPATRHLIGAPELAAMRRDACLINIARGGLVDQAALVEALRQGHIAGAGLDVFEPEPLPPDSPLWAMENVVISPHVAGFTPHYDEWATDLFAENLRRFLSGEALFNRVDRERGY